MRTLYLQSFTEVKLLLRRRETVFFSLLLPVMFLLFFGALYGGQTIKGTHLKYISYLVPGYTVFATMAIALGTVAVNLAQERQFGILKRLGGTPLRRIVLLAAKVVAGAVLVAAVVVVLILLGVLAYGAHLQGNPLSALIVIAAGILCFTSMGIVLGGVIKAESAVPVANLTYLAFSFLGGVFIPLDQFPATLQRLATLLPSERMVDALQRIWGKGLGLSSTGQDIPVLLLWTVVVMAIGARRFRWQ